MALPAGDGVQGDGFEVGPCAALVLAMAAYSVFGLVRFEEDVERLTACWQVGAAGCAKQAVDEAYVECFDRRVRGAATVAGLRAVGRDHGQAFAGGAMAKGAGMSASGHVFNHSGRRGGASGRRCAGAGWREAIPARRRRFPRHRRRSGRTAGSTRPPWAAAVPVGASWWMRSSTVTAASCGSSIASPLIVRNCPWRQPGRRRRKW